MEEFEGDSWSRTSPETVRRDSYLGSHDETLWKGKGKKRRKGRAVLFQWRWVGKGTNKDDREIGGRVQEVREVRNGASFCSTVDPPFTG